MAPSPVLSLVIPTHRRADILKRTLEHVAEQTIRDQLEVIVVSDGDHAKTADLFQTHSWPMPVRFEIIPKSHQGVARNKGVAMATGGHVLFIGDDIFLRRDACELHLRVQSGKRKDETTLLSPLSSFNSQLAVLGFTTWDPALQITPVMRWLERSGWQFGYPMIENYAHAIVPSAMQHRFTYTSHISLPIAIAKAHPFREDVSLYGWEDVEWGQRLAKAGVKLFYEPDAKAFHHHHLTLEQSLKRMETLGESAVRFSTLVPQMNLVPHGWKKMAYRILERFPTMRGLHAQAFRRGVERL